MLYIDVVVVEQVDGSVLLESLLSELTSKYNVLLFFKIYLIIIIN